MSDRIGVMRAGKLVQVGTPNEIYSSPRNEVRLRVHGRRNIIAVDGRGNELSAADFEATFRGSPAGAPHRSRAISSSGRNHVRFLAGRRGRQRLEGRLYNEYALGSRIQYQVRVGDQVFIVEKLRQQAYSGKLDEVLIGWDAEDCIWS